MRIYHEVNPGELGSVLEHGLRRTSRGEKGDDPLIKKTDDFLDSHCPGKLKDEGLSRDNNVYAYIATDKGVIDIEDGNERTVRELHEKDHAPILEVDVDPVRCYVSNLDTYDALKEAIGHRENNGKLDKLAISYWHSLVPLHDYQGQIDRPEIMIPYDIPAHHVRLARK